MSLSKIPGLVLHLPMNEKNGVVANDNSRYSNDGSLGGGGADKMPVWAEHGLRFDGVDDYVDCGNDSSLDFDSGTQDFTVSVWIKANSFVGNVAILDNRDANDDGWRLTFIGGVLYLSIDAIDITSSLTFSSAATWYQLTGVINRNGNGQLYVNGIANGSAVGIGGEVMDIVGDLYVGSASGGADNFFNGTIDDVRIYSRAISAAEITDLYNERRHLYD